MFVAIVAVAIVSMMYASEIWQALVVSLTLTIYFGMVIVALVGRGTAQAFAIGMAVVMSGYAIVNDHEGTPTARRIGLPTTYLLIRLQSMSKDERYFDSRTAKELVDYDPATEPPVRGNDEFRFHTCISRQSLCWRTFCRLVIAGGHYCSAISAGCLRRTCSSGDKREFRVRPNYR